MRDLATRSLAHRIRTTVLCYDTSKGITRRLPRTEVLDGVVIHRIPFLDLKYYKPAWFPLSILRSHDVIHVHGIGAPLDYIALSKFAHRRPIVVSTHGGIFHTSAISKLKRLYFYGFMPWLIRRVDVVAACSASDETLFAPISKSLVLLENAVAIEPYLALASDRKQRGRCLYVGRLSENKGIDILLRAAAVAKRLGAEFTLRLVGPDSDTKRDRYEALAANLGLSDCVEFVGEVSREALLLEYQLAENFVSASLYEGFGLSAIEAKAAGCRLLLHCNEAFRHIFRSDGMATLVDFGHTESAGIAWANLVRSPPEDTALDLRRETESYSWDRKLGQWSALYREVVHATRGGALTLRTNDGRNPR